MKLLAVSLVAAASAATNYTAVYGVHPPGLGAGVFSAGASGRARNDGGRNRPRTGAACPGGRLRRRRNGEIAD